MSTTYLSLLLHMPHQGVRNRSVLDNRLWTAGRPKSSKWCSVIRGRRGVRGQGVESEVGMVCRKSASLFRTLFFGMYD